MDFRPLNETERKQLTAALRGNADSGQALLLNRRDTSRSSVRSSYETSICLVLFSRSSFQSVLYFRFSLKQRSQTVSA